MGYPAAQAARLCGGSRAQLRRWAESGLVVPDGSGYSFRDLVALRLIVSLHRCGLSTSRIRRALGYLEASGDDLAAVRIVTDGSEVWACHTDGEILDALRQGQLALFVALDRFVADVDAAVRDFDAERDAFVAQLRAAPTGSSEAASGVPSSGATSS